MSVRGSVSFGPLIVFALLAFLALPSSATAVCTVGGTLANYDDEAAMLGDGGGTFIQNGQWAAQSFVSTGTNRLGGVSLFMKNNAPTGDAATVSVRADAAGVPGAVLGQATASTTNTSTFDWLAFDFEPQGLQLTDGATYWIVASNTVTMSGQGYAWQERYAAAAYVDGISRVSSDQGVSWGAPQGLDFGFRVLVCAPVDAPIPSNAFTLGVAELNKKKGTATIAVTLPGPGLLGISGEGVSQQFGQVEAGNAQLSVNASGKALKTLQRKRRVTLQTTITFSPSGGSLAEQDLPVKLKLAKRRKA